MDDDRLLAVQEYEYGSTHAAGWLVLDYEGQTLGRLTMDANVRTVGYRNGILAAVARDSLDVESILLMTAAQIHR